MVPRPNLNGKQAMLLRKYPSARRELFLYPTYEFARRKAYLERFQPQYHGFVSKAVSSMAWHCRTFSLLEIMPASSLAVNYNGKSGIEGTSVKAFASLPSFRHIRRSQNPMAVRLC